MDLKDIRVGSIILVIIAIHISVAKPCAEGDVRLVPFNNPALVTEEKGNVQVCINGTWGMICDRPQWDSREAGVVCRQLGLPSLGAISRLSGSYPYLSGNVWLDEVSCEGNESHLLNCTYKVIGKVHPYIHASVVECLSVRTQLCSDGDIRLVGGETSNEGRVEICYKNSWGTVCDNNWNSTAAEVVCRQLNYINTSAGVFSDRICRRNSGGIYLDEVSCSGSEQALIDCSHRGIGVHRCTHYDDAGVRCYGIRKYASCSDGEVRLIDGLNETHGIVEICYDNQWGTICDNDWTFEDAKVVCRQLGFGAPVDTSSADVSSRCHPRTGRTLLDNVQCFGNELMLLNCNHSGRNDVQFCGSSRDVAVTCLEGNNATRFCDSRGQWGEVNVQNCTSSEFIELLRLAKLLGTLDPNEQIELVTEIVERLEQATKPPGNKSLLPNDLEASVEIVTAIITILEHNNSTNEDVIEIFNNILDENNRQGWQILESAGSSITHELLLSSAERYAMSVATFVNTTRTDGDQKGMHNVTLSRLNIVVVGGRFITAPPTDILFPLPSDLINFTVSRNTSTITIPSSVIKERLEESGNDSVSVVFVLLHNLPTGTFPPNTSTRAASPCTGRRMSTRGASDVIAARVGRGNDNRTSLRSLIVLNFTFESTDDAIFDSYRCAYWNFSVPIGNGSWSIEGVMTNNFTAQRSENGNVISIQCSATHLTSFAVLVNVAGDLEAVDEVEEVALQAVSYVGCGISIVCLSVTVGFFLWQGYYKRRLPNSKRVEFVQYFIHLNLSLSLLLALVVFVLGIETATNSVGGCALVAAILHYLFLCAFCWMLCEGVLLYLLLRVVFSELSKKWWPFLVIGYLTPLPIVLITVVARYQYYGVRNQCGNLIYCWLSVEEGTVFGFVAPMLVIILVNIIFMILALYTLVKAQWPSVEQKNGSATKASTKLGRTLFMAMLVLLPLLGLTWLFGILTVNANSTVFAWLFTLFNSLQGFFIFIFHVIRSDKVWSKIRPKLLILRSKVSNVSNFRWHDLSTGITRTLTRGRPSRNIGVLYQDPNSTRCDTSDGVQGLGRPSSTAVNSVTIVIISTSSSDELKTDYNQISCISETDSEMRVHHEEVQPLQVRGPIEDASDTIDNNGISVPPREEEDSHADSCKR